MTWQDDLQHLETELAAGRISPEEYRTRRDQVSGRSPEQPARPFDGAQPQAGGQPEHSPFPPPFTWVTAAPPEDGAASNESTQIIRNPLTRSAAASDFGPGVLPRGWNTRQGPANGGVASAPANGNPPPESGPRSGHVAGPPPATSAGPRNFGTAPGNSHPKWLTTASIVVVVLAVVAVAVVVFFAFPGVFKSPAASPEPATRQQPQAATQLPEPPAPKPTPPANSSSVLIPALAGPPHPFNGVLTPAGLSGPRQGLLPQQVRDFALHNGMIDGWFRGTEGTPTISLIAIRMPNQSAASNLEKTYLGEQIGLHADNALSYRGVQVVTTGDGTFRTAYVTYQWTVVLDVSAPAAQERNAGNVFKSVLSQQLAQSPPTVRG